ncbi:hypothetical protein ISG33_00495 [Glaciecola sp. MH2013]|uniref:hypothetical protein n=1 Tax=Glaciecola sp. MH2013 TaxID=2785524 RepID=UPI00189F4CFD|nr:hypothetical protein [Glaciecola sp. MH2013]MBF7071875.1 hypothetical protein [Glaciecola sp. MH2013]
MNKKLSVFITLAVSILFTADIDAKQTRFNKYQLDDSIKFEYEWTTSEGEQQSLAFSFKKATFSLLPESAPAYNPLLAQNSAQRALLLYAKTLDPRDARVSISQSGNTLSMKVTGRSEKLVEEVNNMLTVKHDEAQAAYLNENYYVAFRDDLGQKAIKHDHKRYALESAPHLVAIVEAIKEALINPNDTRAFVNYALSWLQAIPYDTLENRASSNGSGFAAPQQLLLNNRGDCDSKSTLFLALLKTYNANVKSTMVYLPNHALVGVALKPQKQDLSIKEGKTSFVLAEPTGPAQYALGEVAPESAMGIRNRQTTLELF